MKDIDFYTSISRAKFEALCEDLFRNCLKPVEKVILDSKIDKSSIDEIVGGSTRIPKNSNHAVSDYFNGKSFCKSINPDEAVAYGAQFNFKRTCGTNDEVTDSLLLLDVATISWN